MSDQGYVTSSAWLHRAGRADHIDDVADQFERQRTGAGPAAGLSSGQAARSLRWPRAPRGWRTMERMHPRAIERRNAG